MLFTLSILSCVWFSEPDPVQECLVPLPEEVEQNEAGTVDCDDSVVECYWVVKPCLEWYDYPDTCAKVGDPVSETDYGKATWGNYYCGCDTFCHPKGDTCPQGKDNLIYRNCESKYGLPECPKDAGGKEQICVWEGKNQKHVYCPNANRCCGNFCFWDPC